MEPNQIQSRIVLDRKSIRELESQVVAAMRESSILAVEKMAEDAADILNEMHTRAGRLKMGDSWEGSKATVEPDGTISAQTLSNFEGKTFYNKSSATGKKTGNQGQRWPVDGDDLLRFIEYGVDPHEIAANEAETLVFDQAIDDNFDFVPNTDFLGAGRTSKGVEIDFIDNRELEQDQIFIDAVYHPGFPGAGFLEMTREMMEMALDGYADFAARKVQVRLE